MVQAHICSVDTARERMSNNDTPSERQQNQPLFHAFLHLPLHPTPTSTTYSNYGSFPSAIKATDQLARSGGSSDEKKNFRARTPSLISLM